MISLQFVTAGTLADKAIQAYEHGWASHVDLVMPDGALLGAQATACGGQPAGVYVRPVGYSTWQKVQRVNLEASDVQLARFLAFARAQIGKSYDFEAIAAFPLGRDWRAPDSWFCSELGAAALEASGWLPKQIDESVNKIAPRDLLMIVSPWAV